jgi:RNA polymerase primary sigma factor
MQLREILDLDAMLSKEPQPENLSEDGEGDGEISEATAGPTFKEEEDIEEEASEEDEDDELRERRTPVRPRKTKRTTPLARPDGSRALPQALEKFAEITASFRAFERCRPNASTRLVWASISRPTRKRCTTSCARN